MTLDISLWITVLNVVMKLGPLFKRWWRRIRSGPRNVPRTAVAVVPARPWPLGWSKGPTIMGQSTMFVLGAFYFTNASDRPLTILNTRLTAYYWKRRLLPVSKRVEGVVTLIDQRGDILPGNRVLGQAHWNIAPAIRRPGAPLVGSACFTDSYGNPHSTGLLTWPYRNDARREESNP